MSQTYVHLSGKDVDGAILKAYGVEVEDSDKPIEEETPHICPRCDAVNPSNAAYCKKCWLPFEVKEAIEQEEKEKSVQEALASVDSLGPLVKGILQNLPPKQRNKTIKDILSSIKKDDEIISKVRKKWELLIRP